MARHHVGQEDGEGAAAAAAPAAIRAEDPLPAAALSVGVFGIVAQQQAVAIQRAPLAAVGAAPLLEAKSSPSNAGSSGTKRTHGGGMRY